MQFLILIYLVKQPVGECQVYGYQLNGKVSILDKTHIDQPIPASPSESSLSSNTPVAIGNIDKSNKHHSKHSVDPKNKRRKNSHREKTVLTSFDDIEQEISSDDNHDDTGGQENQYSTSNTPFFVGRRIMANAKESSNQSNTSSMLRQTSASLTKMEFQYLPNLIVGQERIEASLKCLLANQKKIQKCLRKQKVTLDWFECFVLILFSLLIGEYIVGRRG